MCVKIYGKVYKKMPFGLGTAAYQNFILRMSSKCNNMMSYLDYQLVGSSVEECIL
jgi:hypothetical protein